MDKLLSIFISIDKEPDISQRQLAKATGYSLGTVNGILQKLVDDGDLVLNHVSTNHYNYVITEKGNRHKAKLMYDFALDGYEIIGKIKGQTKRAIEKSIREGVYLFYLYGEEDPIYKLVKMSLIELSRHYAITYKRVQELPTTSPDQKYRILTWNKERLEDQPNTLNILL